MTSEGRNTRLIGGIISVVIVCSISPVLGASEGMAGWGWWETIGRWINLAVLLGIIFYYTREPVGRFLASRRSDIHRELEEARQARDEAQSRLDEMEARMQNLDEELGEIRAQSLIEAEKERDRVLEQAKLEAEKIVATAEREIAGMTRAAREELKRYAADLSLELAEKKLKSRVTPEIHQKLMRQFFSEVKERRS